MLLAANTTAGTLTWATDVEPHVTSNCFVRQTTLVCSETPDDKQNGQNRIVFVDTTNDSTKNAITSSSADQMMSISTAACDGYCGACRHR